MALPTSPTHLHWSHGHPAPASQAAPATHRCASAQAQAAAQQACLLPQHPARELTQQQASAALLLLLPLVVVLLLGMTLLWQLPSRQAAGRVQPLLLVLPVWVMVAALQQDCSSSSMAFRCRQPLGQARPLPLSAL